MSETSGPGVGVSETVGTKYTAYKAWAAGGVSTLIAFLSGLNIAMSDEKVTGNEWVDIALFTVIGAAAGFGITYAVPNRAK